MSQVERKSIWRDAPLLAGEALMGTMALAAITVTLADAILSAFVMLTTMAAARNLPIGRPQVLPLPIHMFAFDSYQYQLYLKVKISSPGRGRAGVGIGHRSAFPIVSDGKSRPSARVHQKLRVGNPWPIGAHSGLIVWDTALSRLLAAIVRQRQIVYPTKRVAGVKAHATRSVAGG
jgi:hypothetical protein